jgi:hypothetical protein
MGDEERDVRAFYETLRNAVVTLRELRQLVRKTEHIPVGTKNPRHWPAENRLHEVAPIHIDTAFMYFRRLADRLTTALRLVLFEKPGSVPRMSFANFREFVTRTPEVHAAGPLFDVPKLQQAFAIRSLWFDRLQRTATEAHGKGIRDSLEHRPTRMILSRVGERGKRAEIFVTIHARDRDVESREELSEALVELTGGFCRLCGEICRAANLSGPYSENCCLVVTGSEDDTAAYWPQI